MNQSRVVAVFKTKFLPYSETFIHDELCAHRRYKTLVLTKKKLRYAEQFSGHNIVSLLPSNKVQNHIEHYIFNKTRRSWTMEQAIVRHGVSIIHAHFAYSGIYMTPLAKKYNIPLIVSLHGNDVAILIGEQIHQKKWVLYKKHYREMISQTNLFLAASQDLKDLIVSKGCPPEKVVVYKLGINLDKFPYVERHSPLQYRILMAGRFVEKKGFIYGIRAFARAQQVFNNAELHIIGDGEERSMYEAEIKKFGISSKVFLHGVRPHEEIVEHMHKATLFLAPSVVAGNQDRDSGLIVAKEAAACGIPVIGSIHGGIPDIIDDGKTGFLVPERDVEQISQRIVDIFSNIELWKKMSMASRKKIEEEYDIIKCNDKLESLYDSLLM